MGKQINQYTKTRTFANLTDADLFDVDSTDDAGTTFESAKLSLLNLVRYINNNAQTYYNGNGSITEDRTVSMNTFFSKWTGGDVGIQMSDLINDYGFFSLFGSHISCRRSACTTTHNQHIYLC